MEKERRKYLLEGGDKEQYSHLVIVVNRSDGISDEIIRYVRRDEDIKDVLSYYICNPNFEILNVYNYDMDLPKQIVEDKPYHVVVSYHKMQDAYYFAKKKHEGQLRKDGRSYITHPIKVAELVRKYFSSVSHVDELVAAAYLHDTVEDTDTTIEEIQEKFGNYVAYLVKGVTNDNQMKHTMGKTNYLCNKMLHMDEDVLNLKLCDRLANVLDLREASPEFIGKYELETIVIINYLLMNAKLTDTQREIIKIIHEEINRLRKEEILKLIKIYS